MPCALPIRSEEHTSELQSHLNLVCRLLLEKISKSNCQILHAYFVTNTLCVVRILTTDMYSDDDSEISFEKNLCTIFNELSLYTAICASTTTHTSSTAEIILGF